MLTAQIQIKPYKNWPQNHGDFRESSCGICNCHLNIDQHALRIYIVVSLKQETVGGVLRFMRRRALEFINSLQKSCDSLMVYGVKIGDEGRKDLPDTPR